MGWRDRDWARLNDGERGALYGPGGGSSGGAGFGSGFGIGGAARGLLAAIGVSLGLYLLGHVPRSHPIVPALGFRLPGLGSPHSSIGTTAATFGSTFTLTGTTPGHRNGSVSVEGSWNGAAWIPLASTATVAGGYVARFPISEHGTLKLRAKYPGGEADGTVLVP